MRGIKFRVWDMLFSKMFSHKYLCEENLGFGSFLLSQEDENIKLMQYTGLKDKNGKCVYESDIVEMYSKVGHTKTIGGIYYENRVCAFMVNDLTFNQYLPLTENDAIEVIGNIYENKELLDN